MWVYRWIGYWSWYCFRICLKIFELNLNQLFTFWNTRDYYYCTVSYSNTTISVNPPYSFLLGGPRNQRYMVVILQSLSVRTSFLFVEPYLLSFSKLVHIVVQIQQYCAPFVASSICELKTDPKFRVSCPETCNHLLRCTKIGLVRAKSFHRNRNGWFLCLWNYILS